MKMIRIPVFIIFLLATFSASAANVVEGYEISGLNGFARNYLSIYYVSGRPAGLGTPGQEISVNKVMSGPHTYTISSRGTVNTERVVVPRDGWSSYNYAIYVVHRQPVHALTNIAWDTGNIIRERVRYLDESVVIDYSNQNQSFIIKTYKTSRELGTGVNFTFQ